MPSLEASKGLKVEIVSSSMAILKILEYPEKFLRNSAQPVENINGDLQGFIDDMAETMYQAPGIGLAAIQAGSKHNLLIYDITPPEEGRSLQVLINPRIVEREGSMLSEGEGCLSVPELRADVKRSERVLVEGFNRNEKSVRIEAEGLHAVVLQHEIDHLNGVLFLDHLSSLKRQMYKRRRIKQLKSQ
jgi:peptide deformylase